MGFAETFKALSAPERREILTMLKDGPISYHLNILKKAELVREQKEKNFIYYELNTSVVEEVMLWLSELREGENGNKRNMERE